MHNEACVLKHAVSSFAVPSLPTVFMILMLAAQLKSASALNGKTNTDF
jgi:hypothetical protein